MHCTALPCTALHSITLHCTALHCTELHYLELHRNTLDCTAPHYPELHCTALSCTVLYYNILYCSIVVLCFLLGLLTFFTPYLRDNRLSSASNQQFNSSLVSKTQLSCLAVHWPPSAFSSTLPFLSFSTQPHCL